MRHETSQTDALGHTTTFTYNSAGDVLSQTDPLGHTSSYTYDAMGRELSRLTPWAIRLRTRTTCRETY